MNVTEYLEILVSEAKKFRQGAPQAVAANTHMHTGVLVTQEQVDAVITCFINSMAASRWSFDLGLYARDLEKQ